MPIVGLADSSRVNLGDGKFIRLGRLNKGDRQGTGRNIKLSDLDYFRFTPYTDDMQEAAAMRQIFSAVYGDKPKAITPVYLPVNISGAFNLADRAWLVSYSYSDKRAPILLGRSDGEWVYRLRTDNRTLRRLAEGELRYDDVTKYDEHGNPCLVVGDRLYPWVQRLSLDLILPDFNDALYAAGLAGYGVIEFNTTSVWDVSNLIDEYTGILGTVADAFCNPFKPGDRAMWLQRVPLREIPLRLYRQEAEITRPAPDSTDPLARYKKPTSLVHWQIAPLYARAINKAHELRGRYWLQVTAVAPLLQSGQGVGAIEQANADLFGDAPPQPQRLGNGREQETAWDRALTEAAEVIEGVFEDAADEPRSFAQPQQPPQPTEPQKGTDPSGIDSEQHPLEGEAETAVLPPQPTEEQVAEIEGRAKAAIDADTWATAVFELFGYTGFFDNAARVKDFLVFVVGESLDGFDAYYAEAGLAAAEVYVATALDGETKRQAAEHANAAFLQVYSQLIDLEQSDQK